MALIKSVAKKWLPVAFVLTVMSAMLCLAAYQVMRQYADDPQIQMAEDAAAKISDGATAPSVLPAGQVDLARGLGTFVMVFDPHGDPLASSGYLKGAVPVLPKGVLDYARVHGEHRLSWQPEPGVRHAIVVVPIESGKTGFVLAGRSLRETEKRKQQVLHLVQIVWLLGMLGTLLLVVLSVSRRDASLAGAVSSDQRTDSADQP